MDSLNPEMIQQIMGMSIEELIAMLSKKGGKVALEIETKGKGKNGRLGSQKPMQRPRFMERDEDDDGGMCCGGFDDESHIGSSY